MKKYLPIILWCGVIFFLSSLETTPTPTDNILNFTLKKSAHIFEYAVLAFLISRIHPKKKLFIFLFCLLYALTDEFHQSFTPGRQARLYDIVFDSLGAFLGLKIYPKMKSKLFSAKL